MKTDRFTWFCLSNEDKEFLKPYISPQEESSVFKWIPVEYKDRVRSLCLKMGLRTRVVYRGPRDRWASHTTPENATHITLYPKG